MMFKAPHIPTHLSSCIPSSPSAMNRLQCVQHNSMHILFSFPKKPFSSPSTRRTPIHPLKPSDKIPYFRKHSLCPYSRLQLTPPSTTTPICANVSIYSLPCPSSRAQSAVSLRFHVPALCSQPTVVIQSSPPRAADGPRKKALLPQSLPRAA